ncbi:MAG: hypothetical protein HQK68_00040 [Desulfamplus sp.]|nr:hypothetical protein [Desulfamplus sp.]
MTNFDELIEENLKLKDELSRTKAQLNLCEQSLETCRQDHNDVYARIIEAQENERRQMAFELHDVLGKSLTAIKFSVEHAILTMGRWRNKNSIKQLQDVVVMVQETIKETREITTSLWPPVLSDLGIVATISWYSREFERIYPWVFINQAINVEESYIPDSIKIVIFRILQEAMNNSIKHSNCKNIDITLEKFFEPASKVDKTLIRGVRFIVADNGKGFTPPIKKCNFGTLAIQDEVKQLEDITPKGLGLLSMKERCKFSGGTFELKSSVELGTTITACWKITENN